MSREEEQEWSEYIEEKAEEYDVDIDIAYVIFDTLGPSEAYDEFITELENI